MTTIQTRARNISKKIESHQLNVLKREDRGGLEFGIPVKADEVVWGKVPENEADDMDFALNLILKAKNRAEQI